MKDVTEGMKRYSSLLKIICNTDDLTSLNDNEWEGAIGVAMTMAVMDGAKPSFFDLAKSIGISHTNKFFDNAFSRLKRNGIFSNNFGLKEDKCLRGISSDTQWKKSSERNLFAWCNIAGISGGFIGL